MKRFSLILLVLLLVAACQPAGSELENTTPEGNDSGAESAENTPNADTEESVSDDDSDSAETTAPVENYPVALSPADANVLRDSDHAKGADDYEVLIIEYGDFQCPACSQFAPVMAQVARDNPDAVKVVFRHFPLRDIHPNAQKAAEASEAAAAQGDFWAYHDALYERQREWGLMDSAEFRTFAIELANEIGLDGERLGSELDSDVHAPRVNANFDEAAALGLPGTPSVLLDGRPVAGQDLPIQAQPWTDYIREQQRIAELMGLQYDAPPPMTIDEDAQYIATVTMEGGDSFEMELYPQSAPQTVNSFVFLAREGYFDGVTFHRVLPGFVAQTGDPSGTGSGGPGYFLPNEIDPNLSHSTVGTVAMANSSAPDTNGSQWYIVLEDAPNVRSLDGSYTIFGQVTAGMDVVQGITPRDPQTNPNAPEGDRIETITISEQ